MTGILKKNEQLVQVGTAAIRGPDGTPLDRVPFFAIVPTKMYDLTAASLSKEERLVIAGTIHTDRMGAEKRFLAAQKGRTQPIADGQPIYMKESAGEFGKSSVLSVGEQKVCDSLIDDLMEVYSAQREAAETGRKVVRGGCDDWET